MKLPKILKHGLEGQVLKLRAEGLTQTEIAERTTETTGISITQAAVSRFFADYAPLLPHSREQLKEGVNAMMDRVSQLKQLNSQLLEDLKQLRSEGDMRTGASYYNQLHKNIELQARLLGEFTDASTTVNIINNPQIVQLSQVILEEVDDATKQRIVKRLEAVIGGGDGNRKLEG